MSVLTSFVTSPVAPVPKNNFSVTISAKLIVQHMLNLKTVTDWNTTHHWKQLSRQNLKYFPCATQLQELGITLYYITTQHNSKFKDNLISKYNFKITILLKEGWRSYILTLDRLWYRLQWPSQYLILNMNSRGT